MGKGQSGKIGAHLSSKMISIKAKVTLIGKALYRPNDLFRVKVLGMFPKVAEDVLIPYEWIEIANENWKRLQEEGFIPKKKPKSVPMLQVWGVMIVYYVPDMEIMYQDLKPINQPEQQTTCT